MQSKKNRMFFAIMLASMLLILDQIVKFFIAKYNMRIILIPNVFEIVSVQNTGGAFGIGEGNLSMFIISTVIVLGLIIRFIYIQKDYMDNITLYSLFIILAGGIGNLIDRLIRGYVVDFIKIFPSTNFPNFNFADCYITIGWIILTSTFAFYTYKEIKISKNIKE